MKFANSEILVLAKVDMSGPTVVNVASHDLQVRLGNFHRPRGLKDTESRRWRCARKVDGEYGTEKGAM